MLPSAAVIGEQFDVRLLAAAAGMDRWAALSALAGGVAGVLHEDGTDPSGNRFAVRYPFVHEAIAQERLVAECVRRHIAMLEAAERMRDHGLEVSATELARHAVAAGDRRWIVAYSQAAAAEGLRRRRGRA